MPESYPLVARFLRSTGSAPSPDLAALAGTQAGLLLRLAPAPRPFINQRVAWTSAWFAPDQHRGALAHWPSLGEDLADPIAYNGRLEVHLRQLHRETGRRPSIAPVDVDEFIDWAARAGYDADTGSARSRFAAELARNGHALAWPPGRNDPCWCRSGRKYKRCCAKG